MKQKMAEDSAYIVKGLIVKERKGTRLIKCTKR